MSFNNTYNSQYFLTKNTNQTQYNLAFQKWEEYLSYCHNETKNCIFLPNQQWLANQTWLNSIQYAGKTIFNKEQSWLYEKLLNISSLSPYWSYPYIFGQLMIPIQKNEDNIVTEKQKISRNNAAKYGEMGIKYNCEKEYITNLKDMSESEFEERVNINNGSACSNFQLPQSIGFTYFYYVNNLDRAILNYKLAALSENSPEISKNMPALIAGKLWEHIKSATIWYEKFLTSSKDLEETNKINQQEKILEKMEYYIKKATFELTLDIITNANNNQNKCFQDLDCLTNKWYISQRIKNLIKQCENPWEEIDIIKCNILQYGLNQWYINTNGKLNYPLDPESFEYGRRPDVQDWWMTKIN